MKTATLIAAAILFFAACSPTEKAKEPHPLLGEKIPETATTIAETRETTPAATVLSLEEYPSEALAEAEKKIYYRIGRHSAAILPTARITRLQNRCQIYRTEKPAGQRQTSLHRTGNRIRKQTIISMARPTRTATDRTGADMDRRKTRMHTQRT